MLYALTRRFVLYPDAVVSSYLLEKYRIPYEAVAGRTTITGKLQTDIFLVSRHPDVPGIRFRLDFKTDDVFDRWLRALPDLQGLTKVQIAEAVRQNACMTVRPTVPVPASEKKIV